MKISTNWLKNYIEFDLEAEELAHRLTMVGLEVEEIYGTSRGAWKDVIVGRILDADVHPDAEKLHVCNVDIGNSTIQVVCGAPNVESGQLVPVALVGAELPNNLIIKKARLRGVDSYGMICSERELGLSDDQSGIMVLSGETIPKPGEPYEVADGDTVVEIDVTPNRPDCMSHIGVARELAAILKIDFKKPDVSVEENSPSAESKCRIRILDNAACPRYSARIIDEITVGPSPDWLKTALESVGIRSINNVVDITNYVLMETGHPLHAFDSDLIGGEIVVRKASEGESFQTLDGNDHLLNSEDLLITDSKKGVALAGIMGGLNSEVGPDTKRILLESAYFDPMTVSKTARRIGLYTEASQRFGRGADPNQTVAALNRAAALLAEYAGGKVLRGVVDVYPEPVKPRTIELRINRITEILGVAIEQEAVVEILLSLELAVEGDDPLQVTVPTFRPDLECEIDLIEEVVRHYGYDKIEPKLETTIPFSFTMNKKDASLEIIRDVLVGFGFLESLSSSLVSHADAALLNGKCLSLVNPLGPETAALRTSLLPGLLESCRLNRNRSAGSVRIFELGHVFIEGHRGSNGLPSEPVHLAACMTGLIREAPYWGKQEEVFGFYHLKGLVESLFDKLQITGIKQRSCITPWFKEQMGVELYRDDHIFGTLGQLKPTLAGRWDLKSEVFIFELNINQLLELLPSGIQSKPIPRFPVVRRDIALVMDESVPAGSIDSMIRDKGGNYLEVVELFDVYRGDSIPAGKKSLAFSLTFRSRERTLKEEEIDPVMSSIVGAVKERFSASLRS